MVFSLRYRQLRQNHHLIHLQGRGQSDLTTLFQPRVARSIELMSTSKEEFLDENVICIYRAYIETKAGEARNNIIRVVTPGRDIRSLNLYASNIPNVIEVKRGMEWHGSHSIAQVLIMEISQDVQPGQYTLEIGVEIDGKNYGKVPCIIKVTPETTPRPIPQQPAELPLRIISGPSGVQSLRPKTADGTGRVSWSWTVGNFRGTWEIMVKATYGGKTASKITLFTVR